VTHSREPAPIAIRGTAYPSINAAARALKVTPRCVHKALDAGTLDKVGLTKWGVTTRSGPARTPDARSDP